MRIKEKDVIISMSGGLDSTCLALHMLSLGYRIKAYSFRYGQKHSVELKKLKRNIGFLAGKLPEQILSYQEIDLTPVFDESVSSLSIFGNGDIPAGEYDNGNMASTVIENRNIIFASIIYGKALSWSKKSGRECIITLGIHTGDHVIYPDCTERSQKAAAHTFKISNWGSEAVTYSAPFNKLDKGGVLAKGIAAMRKLEFTDKEITYVLKNTHTCYDPDDKGRSCGRCGSCTERKAAFEANGMKDPAQYI